MDDSIAEAGEPAELLYLRGLAYCAQVSSDGFISDMQLVRFVAVGMSDAANRAATLVKVGLWERADRGYRVRSWLKWNRSAQEIHEYRQQDRERKRDERTTAKPAPKRPRPSTKPSTDPSESASDRSSARSPNHRPSGLRAESETQDSTGQDRDRTEEQHPPTPPTGGSGSRRKTETPAPGFDAFWQAYPAKVDKGHAVLAWNKALKAGADPDAVTAAAQRFRDSPARKVDFTPHPATWLNGERWLDQPTEPARAANARTPFWEN
jgi:hypothetical protein